MRSFVVTVILFAVMLAGIALNALYINNVANGMLLRMEKLRTAPQEERLQLANALCQYWRDHEPLAKLSVNRLLIDRINQNLSLIHACTEIRDPFGFASALALLRESVTDMQRAEALSVENVF